MGFAKREVIHTTIEIGPNSRSRLAAVTTCAQSLSFIMMKMALRFNSVHVGFQASLLFRRVVYRTNEHGVPLIQSRSKKP